MKINSRTEGGSRISGTLVDGTFKGSIYIKGGKRIGSTPGVYVEEISCPTALVRKLASDQSSEWIHSDGWFAG